MSLMIETRDGSIVGVSHHWSPASGTCEAYGTLRFGTSLRGITVYLHKPAEIDEVIAELVALRAKMAAEPCTRRRASDGLLCLVDGAHDSGMHKGWAVDGVVQLWTDDECEQPASAVAS
jgi:hypothetical protein